MITAGSPGGAFRAAGIAPSSCASFQPRVMRVRSLTSVSDSRRDSVSTQPGTQHPSAVEAAQAASLRPPRGTGRRRRDANEARDCEPLLRVRGLGPRYCALLRDQGITTVEALAKACLRGGAGHGNATVAQLKALGINNRVHATAILEDLRIRVPHLELGLSTPGMSDSTAGIDRAASCSSPGAGEGGVDKLTFCVEGNISAGKTTFLQVIQKGNQDDGAGTAGSGAGACLAGPSRRHTEIDVRRGKGYILGLVMIVLEPVEKWRSVGPSGANILQQFYEDPGRYAYAFQNYVFLTRMMQEHDSRSGPSPVRIMERSIFSDRMVFVRAVTEQRWMSDVELALYDSWFPPMMEARPSLVPDGFIYLRTTPETCLQRLHKRNRSEEEAIGLDYLEGLHAKHEDWLNTGSLFLDANTLWVPPMRAASSQERVGRNGSALTMAEEQELIVPDNIAKELFVLQDGALGGSAASRGARWVMSQKLVGIPALVLDANPNIYEEVGLEEQYQQKVASFITFMSQYKKHVANANFRDQMQPAVSSFAVGTPHNGQVHQILQETLGAGARVDEARGKFDHVSGGIEAAGAAHAAHFRTDSRHSYMVTH